MVRTRFAPSPTGFLHIGGVRTALFNWLFARHHDGHFILRIDDTDEQRNVSETLDPILSGLRWLGLDWDEGPDVGGDYGPYFQSQRRNQHQAAVEKLLAGGKAYRDYATQEELQAEREGAQAQGKRFIYSRRWMADTAEQAAGFEAEGRTAVVRLKMPREGVCRFRDLIRGEVEFEWAQEQDHVIQRVDGSCLYHLASVADDAAMEISHVIRAEEHLSNTPRQIFIFEGLGHEPPEFAHLPFVAEPGSRNKLSKRKLEKYLENPDFAKMHQHGVAIADAIGLETAAETFNPVIVDFYEKVGYLPNALVNYLLLLGWALDDRTEFFSREEMIEQFTLERVNRSPASFDPNKLLAFQEHYMQELSAEEKLPLALPYLEAAGLLPSPYVDDAPRCVTEMLQAAGDRIKVTGESLDYPELFVGDGAFPYDSKAFDKRLRNAPESVALLRGFRDLLAATEPFEAVTLEEAMRRFVESEGAKIGQIIHALRVAVTGKSVGFGMFEILEILGQERSLARIDRALSLVETTPS
ncbi:MAG: glutamate--tRNA ligase [Thermoanaerobaculia bacterium]|jgi:glutamyl-tRNA synthetase